MRSDADNCNQVAADICAFMSEERKMYLCIDAASHRVIVIIVMVAICDPGAIQHLR